MSYYNNEPIIIAIDHGYGQIKTANFCFKTGVIASDHEPTFKNDLLIYNDKFYTIGEGHKEFVSAKMLDEDFYILTLAAIGMELNYRRLTSARVHIAAGLPLTWVSEQKDSLRDYLLRNDSVDFTFRGIKHHVDFVGVDIFPQGFAAVADKLREFSGVNMLCDIGNGTMNVMYINEFRPVSSRCFTEKYGTNQCMLAVRENLMKQYGVSIDDSVLDRVIRSLKATIQKLTKAFRDTLPGAADALETMRQTVILLCFHMNRTGRDSRNLRGRLQLYRKKLSDYFEIVGQIKEKSKERKAAQKEKQDAPIWRFQYKEKLTSRIATLTEEIEELQSERKMLLGSMDCKDASQVPEIKKQADNLEKRLRALNQKTESLKQQRDSVLEQYDVAARDGNNRFDPLAIYKARKEIRPEKEDEIKDKLWDEYGPDYSLFMLADSTQQARKLLNEEAEERWLKRELRQQEKVQNSQENPQKSNRKRDDWER